MGGGKGGGNTWAGNQQSTVSIPPEVLARYNAVNARAEDVAQNPFQLYQGSFVAPLNNYQTQAMNQLWNTTQSFQPWFDYSSDALAAGHNAAVPYYAQASSTLGQGLAGGNALAYGGLNTIQGGLGAAQPFNAAASQGFADAYGSAQPLNAAAVSTMGGALSSAQPLNNAAISQMLAGLQGASPYNNMAGGSFGAAYANAQPYQTGATNLALAGTGAVNPGDLDIARYFSPYNDAAVKSTLGLLDQQQAQQQNALKGNAILAGAYGGDRAGIASSVLSGQQGLARSQVASDLYNQMYNQALGVAQQQQGLDYSAQAANRAALQSGASTLAGIGNQGFMQGYNTAQGYAGLGNQLYNQGLGAANLYGNIGNQMFGQGATAAGLYGNIGNQMYNQGMGAAQGQLAVGNQMFGQNLAAGQAAAGIGNQIFGQGLGAAQAQQGIGQGLYQQGLANSQQFANIGQGLGNLNLAGNQALLGAGTVGQQTDQANLQAQYNQFLQQQAYPFQVAQFLANIAMGTGSLSGSTTTTSANQPQPFFSDERLKEDIREIGKTKDGIPIISFKYKGSPHTQIGMRAQDVEDVRPEAVGLSGGYKTVDYDRATKRANGGLVPANDDGREGFAAGGYNGMMDPVMAQILAAHSGMYPGGAGRPGMDVGPRGIQLAQLPTGKLAVAQPAQFKQSEPGMRSAIRDVNDIAGLAKTGAGLYDIGKDALVGTKETVDKAGNVTPASGGLLGSGGKWSPESGWFGKQTGLGAANANTPTNTVKTEELSPSSDPSSASAAPADVTRVADASLDGAPVNENIAALSDELPVEDIVDQALAYAWRGGRMRRKAGGGMPYAGVDTYVPDEGTEDYSDNFKKSQALAEEALADARRDQERGSGKGGGDKGLGRAAGSLVGMGVGSMFGMPMVGSAAGGLFGGLFNQGGRIHKVGGGFTGEGEGLDPDEIRRLVESSPNVVPLDPRNSWLSPVAEAARAEQRAGLNPPPTPPVSVQATPPAGLPADQRLNVPPIAASARAPDEGLGAAVTSIGPPTVTPEQARTAIAPVAAAIPTPASAGLNPRTAPPTPAGFRSPAGVDSPEDYLVRMQTQESGNNQFNPKTGAPVTSSAGAIGIMQVMPGTGPEAAKLAGLPWNPELFNRGRTGDPDKDREATDYNRALGRAYYLQQVKDFGDPAIAAAAYNAGPGAVREAQAKAAASGGNYLDYLPKETRDYVAIVSGKGGRGSTVALNVQNGPQDGGGLNPATSLQPPADAAPKPPRDFLDRAGDWIDRNERPIMAGLSFLGNMLASPSRTLAGSIGSGLAAAAPQYLSAGFREKELGQGQQRIDITRTAQLITMYNQLRGMIASQIAGSPNGRADPDTVAQANRIAQMIAEGSKTGPNGLPTIGGGAAGSPQQPAGGPAAPTPTQIPPATGAPPAAPPAPAASPPAPTAPAASPNLPPSMQQPGSIEASFYERLAPDNNPANLRMRARNMEGIAPEQAAALRARADQIDAQIQQTGKGVDRSGNVIMSEAWPQIEAAQRRTVENPAFMREQQTAFQARQVMAENVRKIAETVRDYEPGKLNDLLADIQATLQGAGIPVRSTPTMNAEAYQKFVKEAASVLSSAPTGDQRTDQARAQLAAAFATPNLQPGAVRSILAQTLGKFEMLDDQYRDVTEKLPRARYMDIPLRYNELEKEKPLDTYTARHLRDTPVLGDLPKEAGGLKDGFVYMVTPADVARFLKKDPKAMREAMGGTDKPQAARVIFKDGIPTFKSPP